MSDADRLTSHRFVRTLDDDELANEHAEAFRQQLSGWYHDGRIAGYALTTVLRGDDREEFDIPVDLLQEIGQPFVFINITTNRETTPPQPLDALAADWELIQLGRYP